MLDAIDERGFEALVAGHGDQVAGGELLHVAAVALAEGAVLGIEGDLVAIQQGVVGAGLGEELDDQRDGVDEHEQQGEDDVGVEGELAALVAGLEKAVEGERLGEDVAAGFGADGGEAGAFLGGDAGEFVLDAVEFLEAGVDLQLDGFAQGVLLGDEGSGLVFLDLALEGGDAFGFDAVGGLDLGEAGLESGDGAGLRLADAGSARVAFSAVRCSSSPPRRFDSSRRGSSWSERIERARGPSPMRPERWPLISRSNSVCQKLQLGLELGVERGEFADLFFDRGEAAR